MTLSQNLFEKYYSNDWPDFIQPSSRSFLFLLHDHADMGADSIRTFFLYVVERRGYKEGLLL